MCVITIVTKSDKKKKHDYQLQNILQNMGNTLLL